MNLAEMARNSYPGTYRICNETCGFYRTGQCIQQAFYNGALPSEPVTPGEQCMVMKRDEENFQKYTAGLRAWLSENQRASA